MLHHESRVPSVRNHQIQLPEVRTAKVKVLWLGRLLGRRFRSLRRFRSFRLAAIHIAFPVKSGIVAGWKGYKRWQNPFLLPLSIHSTNTNGSKSNICNYQIRSTPALSHKYQGHSVSSKLFVQWHSLFKPKPAFQGYLCASVPQLWFHPPIPATPGWKPDPSTNWSCKDSTLRTNDERHGFPRAHKKQKKSSRVLSLLHTIKTLSLTTYKHPKLDLYFQTYQKYEEEAT